MKAVVPGQTKEFESCYELACRSFRPAPVTGPTTVNLGLAVSFRGVSYPEDVKKLILLISLGFKTIRGDSSEVADGFGLGPDVLSAFLIYEWEKTVPTVDNSMETGIQMFPGETRA